MAKATAVKAKATKAKTKTKAKTPKGSLGSAPEIEQGFVCRDHEKLYVCGGAVITERFWKLTDDERKYGLKVEQVDRREGGKAPGKAGAHDLDGLDAYDFEGQAHTVLTFRDAQACADFADKELNWPKEEGLYLCGYPARTIWEDLTEQGEGAMQNPGRKG